MGLTFKKELVLSEHSIRRDSLKYWSLLQEKLVAKFGKNAYPFHLEFPDHCSASVTIVPESLESGEPCGVEYFVRVKHNSLQKKLSVVNLTVRKIQFAPRNIQRSKKPVTLVRKHLSSGLLELEASLDNHLYSHGDEIMVDVNIRNNSNKTVKRISAVVLQQVDIAMFKGGNQHAVVTNWDSQDGCPIQPGSSLSRKIYLTPTAESCNRHGLALEGRVKGSDTCLASSTLLADTSRRDVFGVIVSYSVKIKLLLGAINGSLSAEIPFVLMHPSPRDRKIMKKRDTLESVESFGSNEEIA
ncbi:phosrestin-2 isoform X2 [Eurytemora carolleeae]|nr:phosrestin-2 isoform X2 [Eurytemora carolleeae]|eukprot:XP_023340258.1 phosrestin-2-like isoform X2 [Eurytemora affinis]